ncbi:hypothetical protein N7455_008222 [Penicillium solitum]|uniref:uncharacterized protein n=1 Tax=Penicillium solitum TaxID=60172 RepID=UPI0017A0D10E|nr:hypothetical protein HAV15_004719 [Penicillium sp. str. \
MPIEVPGLNAKQCVAFAEARYPWTNCRLAVSGKPLAISIYIQASGSHAPSRTYSIEAGFQHESNGWAVR